MMVLVNKYRCYTYYIQPHTVAVAAATAVAVLIVMVTVLFVVAMVLFAIAVLFTLRSFALACDCEQNTECVSLLFRLNPVATFVSPVCVAYSVPRWSFTRCTYARPHARYVSNSKSYTTSFRCSKSVGSTATTEKQTTQQRFEMER